MNPLVKLHSEQAKNRWLSKALSNIRVTPVVVPTIASAIINNESREVYDDWEHQTTIACVGVIWLIVFSGSTPGERNKFDQRREDSRIARSKSVWGSWLSFGSHQPHTLEKQNFHVAFNAIYPGRCLATIDTKPPGMSRPT